MGVSGGALVSTVLPGQVLGSGAHLLSALCPLCRYWVPEHLIFDFVKSLAAREAALQSAPGFLGLVVTQSTAGVGPGAAHLANYGLFLTSYTF